MMHVSPNQETEGIPSNSPFNNQLPQQKSLYPSFPVVFLPPGMQANMQPQGNGSQTFLNPMQFPQYTMPPVQVNLPASEQLETQASPPVNETTCKVVVTEAEQDSTSVTATEGETSATLNATPQQAPMQQPFQPMQFTPVMFPQMPLQTPPQMPMQSPQFPTMQPPMVPTLVQVQTPQGIQYIQTFQYAQPPLAPNQFMMDPGMNYLNPPGHPTIMMHRSESQSSVESLSRNSLMHSNNTGNYSRSRCGRSNSSFDGSEYGDNQLKVHGSNSLNRFNSDVSISRDGYGSDSGYSRSRMGSEYFDEDYSEREDEESAKHRQFYSPERRKRPTSKERQEELFKTELCTAWINQKKCRFGSRCIFAHGQNELRLPQRKIERNKLRPPLRQHLFSLLNKLTDVNSDTVVTEFLSVCVEDIVNDIEKVKVVAQEVYKKAITDKNFKHLYVTAWRKLLHCHPLSGSFIQAMDDSCMSTYLDGKNKNECLGCMAWVSVLVMHNIAGVDNLVHRILKDMFEGEVTEFKVELWCKLIELLKDRIDTNKYIEHLNNNIKTGFGASIRFLIIDLVDLKARSWVPAEC